MRRRWKAFDQSTLSEEFRALPTRVFRALTFAMADFRDETGIHYRVERYPDGILMITVSGRAQGRCLFFAEIRSNDDVKKSTQDLVALRVYKKETKSYLERNLRLLKSAAMTFLGEEDEQERLSRSNY